MGETATFGVELEDGVSSSAEDMEASLEKLRGTIIEDTAALRQMEGAMRQMQKGSVVNIGAFRKLRDQIDAQKNALGQAQGKYVNMGGTFERLKKGAVGLGAGLDKTKSALQGGAEATEALGGAAGDLTSKFRQLIAAGPAAMYVVAAAAVVLFTVAIVAAVVKLTIFAIKTADAARSTNLLRQAATGSVAGAKSLGNAIDRVAKKAAVARDQLESLGLEFVKAGFKGKQLEQGLGSIAVVTATMGEAAGSKLKATIMEATKDGKFALADMEAAFDGAGVSIGEVTMALADNIGVSMQEASRQLKSGKITLEQGMEAISVAVEKKLGGIAKKQLLSLDAQVATARDNLGKLFKDIKVEAFLKGLKSVLGLLDQNTSSGKALKTLMTTLINPMVAALVRNVPIIKALFKGIIIGALLVAIGVLKVKNAIKQAFGDTGNIDMMKVAMYAGVVAVGMFATGVALLIGLMAAVAAPFIIVGVMIYSTIAALIALGAAFSSAVDAVTDFGKQAMKAATDAGGKIISGLVKAITSGTGAVAGAMSAMASSAMSAFDGAFDINSPSREMKKRGGYIVEGTEDGIDEKASDVQKSMDNMLDPNSSKGSNTGASGGGGRSVVINIAAGAIVINGGSSSTMEQLEEAAYALFVKAARQAGLVVA